MHSDAVPVFALTGVARRHAFASVLAFAADVSALPAVFEHHQLFASPLAGVLCPAVAEDSAFPVPASLLVRPALAGISCPDLHLLCLEQGGARHVGCHSDESEFWKCFPFEWLQFRGR